MVIQRHHLPDPQTYAIEQERARHDDALYAYGEYAMFVLLWRIEDHELGLVERCSECYTAYGAVAEVYQQPSKNKCPTCFGTTFEGGYKAKIVRPSLWDFNEEDFKSSDRGEVIAATASVQTTSDFRLRTGDYICRADGTRWQMKTISTNHLRTGFLFPNTPRTALGFNFGQVAREDEASVAFLIEPSPADLSEALDLSLIRLPASFSSIEDVRGPLGGYEQVPFGEGGFGAGYFGGIQPGG